MPLMYKDIDTKKVLEFIVTALEAVSNKYFAVFKFKDNKFVMLKSTKCLCLILS